MVALLLRSRRPFSFVAQRLHLRCFSTSLPYVKEEEKVSCVETGSKCSFIHPSAVVHPDAILGQGVSIGPFCTVGPSAKLGSGCQLYPGSHVSGDTKIGDNCTLMMGAVVGDDLPGCTVIGYNNKIGHHAVVGIKCQDMKYKPGNECFLEIGDNNDIREFASIHRSSRPDARTIIGDNNLIMGSCHIAHDCRVGNHNIFANNTLLAGHVNVEDYTHTAGATVIHQFCHIGSFSFIGGGSVDSVLNVAACVLLTLYLSTPISGQFAPCKIIEPPIETTATETFRFNIYTLVSQDVPKYTMVSGERAELRGLNLEGLRRRGFSVGEIRSLRAAYRRIFMPRDGSCESIEERLCELEKDGKLGGVVAVCLMVQSIRDSFSEYRRGICKFRSWTNTAS